jgi:hypothetical protein
VSLKKAEMDKFAVMYGNPVVNAALTFVEPLPVGLVFALVSSRRVEPAEESPLSRHPA